jgi:aspartate-semialdehyde dehydrogenase
MKQYRVAVLGAAGIVGQELLKVLEQRNFPIAVLRLLATDGVSGKKLYFRHTEVPVLECKASLLSDIEIAFFAGDVHASRHFVQPVLRAGGVVIDDTDAWRLEGNVPLIVPEVNAEDMRAHQGVVSVPTCVTVQLAMALAPLHRLNPLRRVIVTSYQSVSESGFAAMEELTAQSQQVLGGQKVSPHVYPHQIAFNVLPQADVFLDTGYSKEEHKLREETRKVLHAPELEMSATCVRVPVYTGHAEAVHAEFTLPFPPTEAKQVLLRAPGIKVLDDTDINLYPQPWTVVGTDEVYVGRIRKDTAFKNGLALWTAADNIRKGAALSAVQVAEEMVKLGLINSGRAK